MILTAIVTPFDARGRVNEEAFVALMRHLADNGSDGFVVAGTTGEASTLTDEEQLGLIELAIAERPEGKSIVAGTGTNDTRQAVRLTEAASELGVDATLSVTPYYNKPSRLGLKRHYEAVARASDKPVLLYNIPGRTATNMAPDLLAELAQIDGITGVKQANAAELQLIDGLDMTVASLDPHTRRGLRDLDGRLTSWMSEHRAHAVLVRPDFYVFGSAASPEELSALLDDLSSQLHLTFAPATSGAI